MGEIVYRPKGLSVSYLLILSMSNGNREIQTAGSWQSLRMHNDAKCMQLQSAHSCKKKPLLCFYHKFLFYFDSLSCSCTAKIKKFVVSEWKQISMTVVWFGHWFWWLLLASSSVSKCWCNSTKEEEENHFLVGPEEAPSSTGGEVYVALITPSTTYLAITRVVPYRLNFPAHFWQLIRFALRLWLKMEAILPSSTTSAGMLSQRRHPGREQREGSDPSPLTSSYIELMRCFWQAFNWL